MEDLLKKRIAEEIEQENISNLALLNAMADDPKSHGITKAMEDILIWATTYIEKNWNPQTDTLDPVDLEYDAA